MKQSAALDFFVIGCQRSGTTLMRLILDSHSLVGCLDEPQSYRAVAATERSRYSTKALLGAKVPCLTEQFGQATLWDRRLLEPTPNPYHGQPLIFLVRDARDTVASMHSLTVAGRSWIQRSARPTVLAKRRRDAAFASRYRPFLHLADSREDDVGLAAFYWRYKTDALREYASRGWPLLPVRYEDVVSQPLTELARVCRFLGIPWEPSLLEHHNRPHSGVSPSGTTTGGTDGRRQIDDTSVGRWGTIFTEREGKRIIELAGESQQMLYGD